MSKSRDFIKWSPPRVILTQDWHAPYGTEFYGMSGFEYFGNYIGLIWIYNNAPGDKSMNIQLASSSDGENWHRASNRKIFMDTGKPDDWDGGTILMSFGPVVSPPGAEDELWFYYGGGTTTHYDKRFRQNSIGLATLRIDSFTSMHSGIFNGKLRTKPIRVSGSKMYCNYKTLHGGLKIKILDTKKNILYESKKFTGNEIRKLVEWNNIENLDLKNRKIVIIFYMNRCDLFSFWFE
ncbi:hypothetical protein DRQ09_01575 [candidate division KSB1 bacterium]|nr:MAG: hypothetical protein DRQ09_01575 [candidate division KSB1 bacterium]